MSTPYYSDEFVTLYHGDCREITEWLSADVLVTDPPYGISWPAGQLHSDRRERAMASPSIVGDDDTSVRDAVLSLWGKRPAVVFGTWRRPRPESVTHRLIWHKRGRQPGVSPHAVFPNDEEIYLCGTGWVGPPSPTVITTLEQRARQPGLVGHPTPKPVHLKETVILKCPAGLIADPFTGSGATLLAARNQGRCVIGVELEERYCELTASRPSQDVLFGGAA